MITPKDQIWNLLQSSSLLPAGQTDSLRSVYDAEPTEEDPTHLLDWLLGKGLITEFHHQVIGAGAAGPFVFGEYQLLDRLGEPDKQSDSTRYSAKHLPTQHPVRLDFFPSSDDRDHARWKQVSRWCEKIRHIQHANLAACHQQVILPEYRFLVSTAAPGICLTEKIPNKKRLPAKNAAKIIGFVAMGLEEIHRHDQCHGGISPESIWLQPDGSATLQWDCPQASHSKASKDESLKAYQSDNALDQTQDWYGLGCVFYRILSGKKPAWQEGDKVRVQKIKALSKLDVPAPVIKLCHYLTSTHHDTPIQFEKVISSLKSISGRSEFLLPDSVQAPTRSAFLQHLERFSAPSELPDLGLAQKLAPVESSEVTGLSNHSNAQDYAQIAAARRKKKKLTNWAIAGASAVGCLLVGGLIMLMSSGLGDPQETISQSSDTEQNNSTENSTENSSSENNSNQSEIDNSAANLISGWLDQDVVDNDPDLLWESPTEGYAVDWDGVPSAPDFVFTFRPSEVLEDPQGERILQSLGPAFQKLLAQWESASRFELEQVDQLIVSLHSRGESEFEPYFVIKLNEPMSLSAFADRFGVAAETLDDTKGSLFVSDQHSFFVPDLEQDTGSRFFMSDTEFLRSVISEGQSEFGGSMGRLSRECDDDRHFNLFFVPRILSNEQSQALFSGSLAKLRQPLMFFFDDRINGVLLSLHIDEDFYWEMKFDRSLDLPAKELEDILDEELRNTRNEMIRFVTGLADKPYWNSVKQRLDNMLDFVYRHTRVAVENRETIANGWLPGPAAHNLFAAAELSLTSGLGGDAVVTAPSGPGNLQELLDRKRSLVVTSSPDLVLLLNDLQSEIRDDFGNLPFKFEIRLMGSHLGEEGITQNQRPSDIRMPDNSLSEILTEICFKANPDKNATSPQDPACKLIWVKTEDPDQTGREIIMITTRKAATDNNYELPPAFRPE